MTDTLLTNIYFLLLMSEANKLGLIDTEAYRALIKKTLEILNKEEK